MEAKRAKTPYQFNQSHTHSQKPWKSVLMQSKISAFFKTSSSSIESPNPSTVFEEDDELDLWQKQEHQYFYTYTRRAPNPIRCLHFFFLFFKLGLWFFFFSLVLRFGKNLYGFQLIFKEVPVGFFFWLSKIWILYS